jgi:hypothetical protein
METNLTFLMRLFCVPVEEWSEKSDKDRRPYNLRFKIKSITLEKADPGFHSAFQKVSINVPSTIHCYFPLTMTGGVYGLNVKPPFPVRRFDFFLDLVYRVALS